MYLDMSNMEELKENQINKKQHNVSSVKPVNDENIKPEEEYADKQEFVKIAHLKPGTILRGKSYSEAGEFLFEEYHIFTEKDIEDLIESGDESIYYVPVRDTLSSSSKEESLKYMQTLMKTIKEGNRIDIDEANRIIGLLITDVYSNETGILNLIQLKDYSEYAYVHSINVGILSIMLAKKMGFKPGDAGVIGLGAFLHDIGKLNIPKEIVWKIKGDNDHEDKIIKEHPMFGNKILQSSGGIPLEVFDIVTKHHENFDGSGYPSGLSDESLNKKIKIISICNYYLNLTETVEGKKSLPPRLAVIQINRQSGKMFHPLIVKSFTNDLSYLLLNKPIFPLGTLLLLNTKELAVVVKILKYSDMKPVVRIITDSKSKILKRPIIVNLLKDHSRRIHKIMQLPEDNKKPGTPAEKSKYIQLKKENGQKEAKKKTGKEKE